MDYQRSKIVWFVKNLKESRGRKANMCGVDKLDVTGATEYLCVCSVAKFCATLCNPMDCSMPGFPVLHYLLKFTQNCVHCVSDAIQPSHPLLPPSLSAAFNLSQHQSLFK